MHYAIEADVFDAPIQRALTHALERRGLTHTLVRSLPFSDRLIALDTIPIDGRFDLDAIPAYQPGAARVFCFGSVKLARLVAELGWSPGSMLNANHDFTVYRAHYGDHLLNADSHIRALGDALEWAPGERKFIRPTQDTKAFAGQVFTEAQWRAQVPRWLRNHRSPSFHEQTEIQVSAPKAIQEEIRFWVVGGRVITGSQYSLNGERARSASIHPAARAFAQAQVDTFQLAEAFVIDICRSGDAWKIVECGCINCAGPYMADLDALIAALEAHFDA